MLDWTGALLKYWTNQRNVEINKLVRCLQISITVFAFKET